MRCRKPLDYPSSYPMIIPIHPCRQGFPRDSKTVGTCLHQWFCDSSNGNCPNEESDVKTNWFLVLLLVILESNSDVGQGRHGIVAAASSNSMPTSLFFFDTFVILPGISASTNSLRSAPTWLMMLSFSVVRKFITIPVIGSLIGHLVYRKTP